MDVLLVPNGLSTVASNALGPAGRRAIIDWVNGGGRYVGWRGGADLAARIGITTALLSEPKSDIAGTLIRVLANQSSPLAAEVGPFNWVFLVANPGGRTGDDHPFAAALAGDLAGAGVRVLAFRAP